MTCGRAGCPLVSRNQLCLPLNVSPYLPCGPFHQLSFTVSWSQTTQMSYLSVFTRFLHPVCLLDFKCLLCFSFSLFPLLLSHCLKGSPVPIWRSVTASSFSPKSSLFWNGGFQTFKLRPRYEMHLNFGPEPTEVITVCIIEKRFIVHYLPSVHVIHLHVCFFLRNLGYGLLT